MQRSGETAIQACAGRADGRQAWGRLLWKGRRLAVIQLMMNTEAELGSTVGFVGRSIDDRRCAMLTAVDANPDATKSLVTCRNIDVVANSRESEPLAPCPPWPRTIQIDRGLFVGAKCRRHKDSPKNSCSGALASILETVADALLQAARQTRRYATFMQYLVKELAPSARLDCGRRALERARVQ